MLSPLLLALAPGAPPTAPHYPPATVSLAGTLGYAPADRCRREASDVVACVPGLGVAGAEVGARYRLIPELSLGLRGAAATAGDDLSLYQAALTARLHPLPQAAAGLHLTADAGVAALSEELAADELGPATRRTRTLPVLGLTFGVDAPLLPRLALTPALRGFLLAAGPGDPLPPRGTALGTAAGLELSLGLALALGD